MIHKRKITVLTICNLILITIIIFTYIIIKREDVENAFVEINESQSIFTEDDYLLEPGSAFSKILSIKNKTTKPIYFKLYLDNFGGFVSKDILLQIYNDSELLHSCPITELSYDYPYICKEAILPKETINYNIAIKVLETAGNEYIGEYITFEIVVELIKK